MSWDKQTSPGLVMITIVAVTLLLAVGWGAARADPPPPITAKHFYDTVCSMSRAVRGVILQNRTHIIYIRCATHESKTDPVLEDSRVLARDLLWYIGTRHAGNAILLTGTYAAETACVQRTNQDSADNRSDDHAA